MFEIPVRFYQFWAAAHLSTPHYLSLFSQQGTNAKSAHKHAYMAGKKNPSIPIQTRENEVKKLKGGGNKNKNLQKPSQNCCLAWLNATNLNKLGMPVFSPADTVPALFRFFRVNELALKESFKEPC